MATNRPSPQQVVGVFHEMPDGSLRPVATASEIVIASRGLDLSPAATDHHEAEEILNPTLLTPREVDWLHEKGLLTDRQIEYYDSTRPGGLPPGPNPR
jgi:hypothetical protein